MHPKLFVALALSAGLALSGAAAAAPITLTDGVSQIVVDPETQDGWADWITNGSVDHLGKHWFWWRLGKEGPEQSIDTLNLDSTAVSDADGDGDDDTLILKYSHPDGVFTLEIRWNLMTGPQLQASGFGLIYAQVTEHMLINMAAEGDDRDLFLFRYVNPEMGGSGNGDQIGMSCLWEPEDDDCGGAMLHGEHDGGPEDISAAFSHVFSGAPVRECNWDEDDSFECGFNKDVVELGYYPALLNRLTDGSPTMLETDSKLRGVDLEDCDPCNIDWAGVWRHRVAGNRQIVSGAVHYLRSPSVLPMLIGGLPGIRPLFDGLVLSGDLFASTPNGLRRFAFRMSLMSFFSERQLHHVACRMWDWAVDRSDGTKNDLVEGKGLPILQNALMQAGMDDGCYVPDPVEPK